MNHARTPLGQGRPTLPHEIDWKQLERAAGLCHVPRSTFPVGAYAIDSEGNYHRGANIEFSQGSLRWTIHAEQVAICQAWQAAKSVEVLVVSMLPCGHCRQFLMELEAGPQLELRIASEQRAYRLGDLLPHPFGPSQLHASPLSLTVANWELGTAPWTGAAESQTLLDCARTAAQRSHVPYTRRPAGFAARTQDGRVVVGAALQNAAYNPGLDAWQVCAANLVMAGYQPQDVTLACSLNSESDMTDVAMIERVFPAADVHFIQIPYFSQRT